ncbi:MAG: sulfatase [Opitutaceae bacterium]
MLSDDQGWAGLSVALETGNPASRSDFCETPHLEALAAQGMRFSRAYAPAPVCSPTRISLQTGRSPAALHWTKAAPVMTAADGYPLVPPASRKQILASETSIAEVLKRAGYATAHFGKWHLGGGGPEAHGYDVSDGATDNQDAAPFTSPNPVDIFGMGGRAVAFMEQCARDNRPFFVQLSYHALHYPENALPATIAKYRAKDPRRNEREIERAAMTENLDTGVGRILARISELGLDDRTYVIYMSDNGSGGQRNRNGLSGGKGSLYEGGIRVPLIVRGPGIGAGSQCGISVAGYDLFPTFLHWSGSTEPLPPEVEGGDLGPLLRGDADSVKRAGEALVFHFPHYQSAEGPTSAIIQGDFKLLHFYETDADELYNLSLDPGETRDLSGIETDIRDSLKRRLSDHLSTIGAQLPIPNPAYDPDRNPSDDRKNHKKEKAGKTPASRPPRQS